MADLLHVEVVSADRVVWSGDASSVSAKTVDGDIGILPHHSPVLAVLVEGPVDVVGEDNDRMSAAVRTGFLSVADNRVSILSEVIELADDIDLESARSDLQAAEGRDDDESAAVVRWAQARIRVKEQH